MKNIKHFLSLTLILSLTFLFSCKKDNDTPAVTTHKVVYKAVASAGSSIGIAVVSDGKGGNESFTSLSGSTWTSPEYTVPSSVIAVAAAVSATGTSATSTLNLQIWVDGVMKSEGKSTGAVLSANAAYSFQ
ncbi:hypothetical protein [Pedobacter rhizosphaerae]|uniref:Uncharacterized protein n=1 Tax=Pedobacter rhizosphaerae TaxID=390241 RepID=A0A1H9W331_9SPHI|nr:hypothetical protein [Pedobacter rhizosphaerae]SES27903.1 hypothetical protein SAMN04488023_1567 [Pedobacter rhizosphaerae]